MSDLVVSIVVLSAASTVIALVWAAVMREKWSNEAAAIKVSLALERDHLELNKRAVENQAKQVQASIELARKRQRDEQRGEEWRNE
mgnify:CR=1 FL=1